MFLLLWLTEEGKLSELEPGPPWTFIFGRGPHLLSGGFGELCAGLLAGWDRYPWTKTIT